MMNNDNSEEGSGGSNALHCTQKTNNPQWPQRNFVGTYRAGEGGELPAEYAGQKCVAASVKELPQRDAVISSNR